MRWYFADLLACPVCKAYGDKLLVHAIEESEAQEPPSIERVRCKHYCALHRKPASEVPLEECRRCSRREIVAGVIVCLNCGRWYPILEGIPVMLDDDYLDLKTYRVFARKYLSRIPADILELMRKPSPQSLAPGEEPAGSTG